MLKLLCTALGAAMCLATPQWASANPSPQKMEAMADLLDKLEREDLLEGIEKANACTTRRNFSCADTTLLGIKKLINGPEDKKLWEMASNYRRAEQQRIDDEVSAEKERVAQIRAQERRAEAAQERERQAEEARERRAQEARESAVARQGVMAILGAAAIGKATSGANYTDAQRRALVESYTKDRVNAINGVESNNFSQQTETVKKELDATSRARIAAAEEARRQQAEQMRMAVAERRAEEARQSTALAQRRAAEAQAKPVSVAAAPPELPRYQPQVVVIPAAPQTCPPGLVPARNPNGTTVTVAPGAYCVRDPNANSASAQGTNTSANKGAGKAGSAGGTGATPGVSPGGGAGAGTTANGADTTTAAAGTNPSPGGAGKDEKTSKKPEKKLFRKTPAEPPAGNASQGLTTPKGNYKCDAINTYGREYEKTARALGDARYATPYRSAERCQARCDLLAWREEIITSYKYRGSWSCSIAATGIWNITDAAGDYRGYHDGKNDDDCTCVTGTDVPITFTP